VVLVAQQMETHKYLIIQTAFLGDCILTLPLIQKIYELYNNSIIDVITTPQGSEIFKLSPYLNNIFIFDKRNANKGFNNILKFARDIRKNNYDTIISPHRSARTALLSFFIHSKERISFDKSSLSFLYTNRVKYLKNIHEIQRNLKLIGLDISKDELKKIHLNLNFSDLDTRKVDNILMNKNKTCAIAPGSVWKTKEYPIEYYYKIIDFLFKNEYIVYIIGSKSEKLLANKILENFGSVIDLTGQLTIRESIYFLSKVNLLIANDSAPTHMGSIVNTNVLTLYCSTIPEFGFFPFNEKGYYLSLDLDCKPCGIHGHQKCPKGHYNCAYQLNPEIVINKIREIIR